MTGQSTPHAYQSEYPSGMLSIVATEQIAVRLPVEQLDVLDQLVARGAFASRAAAVRAGVAALVEADRRHQDDLAIVEGYRRVPPTSAEHSAAVASLRDAIAEEPW
jgi:Arc/MetJ-type ribon-helix-helix transcriptional regulator